MWFYKAVLYHCSAKLGSLNTKTSNNTMYQHHRHGKLHWQMKKVAPLGCSNTVGRELGDSTIVFWFPSVYLDKLLGQQFQLAVFGGQVLAHV